MTNEPETVDETDKMISTALASFSPNDAAIASVREYSMALKVRGPEDMEGYNACHRQLQEVRSMLGSVDKKHEELKSGVNRYGRAVDAERRRLRGALEPVRDHLQAQKQVVDEYRERMKAEAEAKALKEAKDKLDRRMAQILQWRSDLSPSFIESLDDETFAKCLSDSEELLKEKLARAEKEAMERAEREAEELERQVREREERERRLTEQALLDAANRRKLELERQAFAKQMADEKAQREAEDLERRERAEVQRAELERRERELLEERTRIEAAKEADARAAREKREAEERAAAEKEEAERQAALAPAREKLYAFAQLVLGLKQHVPKLERNGDMEQAVMWVLNRAAKEIEGIAQ